MSNLHQLFPLDHEVFRGGRYLEALACLEDIDHWELSILQYLGSKMPFDKGFVGQTAFPSVATISANTKIPQSTVRKKINSLVKKGYLIKKQRRFLNERGHWQQSSNDYQLTNLPFEKFQSVLDTRRKIAMERKRAVGQSEVDQFMPFPEDTPPPKITEVGLAECEEGAIHSVATNSPLESLVEGPNLDPHSSYLERPISERKAEANRIIVNWEEIIKSSVTGFEKRRFIEEYIRTRSSEIQLLEKLQRLEQDPYLSERAKSINFLFKGFDMALKNRAEIVKIGSTALQEARSQQELEEIEKQLPGLISQRSCNFVSPSKSIIASLFNEPLDKARKRNGSPGNGTKVPSTTQELKLAIQEEIQSRPTEKRKKRLEAILGNFSDLSFAHLLDLYLKEDRCD